MAAPKRNQSTIEDFPNLPMRKVTKILQDLYADSKDVEARPHRTDSYRRGISETPYSEADHLGDLIKLPAEMRLQVYANLPKGVLTALPIRYSQPLYFPDLALHQGALYTNSLLNSEIRDALIYERNHILPTLVVVPQPMLFAHIDSKVAIRLTIEMLSIAITQDRQWRHTHAIAAGWEVFNVHSTTSAIHRFASDIAHNGYLRLEESERTAVWEYVKQTVLRSRYHRNLEVRILHTHHLRRLNGRRLEDVGQWYPTVKRIIHALQLVIVSKDVTVTIVIEKATTVAGLFPLKLVLNSQCPYNLQWDVATNEEMELCRKIKRENLPI